MRRPTRTSVLMCGVATLLTACGGDTPTSTTEQSLVESRVQPKGIIDKVAATSPWGVAVRDDGLAFFTHLATGGVGTTNTISKSQSTASSRPARHLQGIVFSPDGRDGLFVANQFGDVSVIDVAKPPGRGLGRHRQCGGRPGLARRCPALRGDRREPGPHRGRRFAPGRPHGGRRLCPQRLRRTPGWSSAVRKQLPRWECDRDRHGHRHTSPHVSHRRHAAGAGAQPGTARGSTWRTRKVIWTRSTSGPGSRCRPFRSPGVASALALPITTAWLT